ncbi:MAG: LamG-like jellyroll fold domain-containing protein [Acidimicrobiales bacterium]
MARFGGARRLVAGAVGVLVLAASSLAVIVGGASSAAAAPVLPPGFSLVPVSTGFGAYDLVDFTFLPSGDLLAAGKCGGIRRVTPGGGSVSVASLTVYCVGDRGLLSIELAPDFAESRTVYTLYNYLRSGRAWARLSRWTANSAAAPTALANEVVVLDDLPSFSATGATCDDSHTIGTVRATADGLLYVGNGDGSSYCPVDTSSLSALDLTSPRGKILRINPDGAGVSTNPFFQSAEPTSWQSRVFAYGVRNPFRFALAPGSRAVYLGDVGWNDYEEIDVAAAGGESFGWPCWEGPLFFRNAYASLAQCQSAYTTHTPKAPLHAWSHNGGGASSVGGAFYTGGEYPADYQGAYFFADYSLGKIWTLRTDANHNLVRGPEANGFAAGIGAPVAFRTGPNGDVFFAELVSGNVYRLRYAAGNRAPVAQAGADRTAGPAPLTVRFDGAGSYDPDDEPLSFSWTFGDGGTGSGPNPTHTYTATGAFTATLTVTDQLGARGAASVVVTPGNSPPVLALSTPPDGAVFAVGDTVSLTATASDPEDGPLPDAAISYSTLQRHCPYGGACHAHPGPVTGEQRVPGGLAVTLADHGDQNNLEITVRVADSRGATTTRTYRVNPDLRRLTVATEPAGVPVAVNSADSNAYSSFALMVGSQNSLIAPDRFGAWSFVRWSDGAPRQRTLTMPAADRSVTALYTTAPTAVAAASPAAGRPPLAVQFSSAGSVDADGDALAFSWDFGDGSAPSTQANPAHTYTAAGAYTARLTVTDVHGAQGTATVAVTAVAPPAGLVAAYGFEETSGAAVIDRSGNTNDGVISGAVRAAGRFGGGLAFNGADNLVSVADSASLDLTSGMTLSAWVRPSSVAGWRTVVLKERPAGLTYALYAGDDASRPSGWVYIGGDREVVGPTSLAVNAWTHLAATYDGAAERLYVNGALVATRAQSGAMTASTGALRIGGNAIWSEWFAGVIDEVRVYNRALTQTEIAEDMAAPVSPSAPPDTSPPSAPGPLSAAGGDGRATLSWAAATDDVGVTAYDVHRSTSPGFAPSPVNRVGAASGLTYTDAPLAAGAYAYRVVARDAAGNAGPASNEAVASVTAADTAAPVASITAPTAGAVVSGAVAVTAAAFDNVGVTSVQLLLDGAPLGAPLTAAPYTRTWQSDGAANGAHTLSATARDAAGNVGTAAPITVTVSNAIPASGLVAAYNFNEGAGVSLLDRVGANHGTVSGAAWSSAGRYGGALSFNGASSRVTMPDAAALDLTTLTVSAWVRPTTTSGWRTVILKEAAGGLSYGLYASGGTTRPSGWLSIGGADRSVTSSTAASTNAWRHLALTYDGVTMRIYLDGVQVGARAQTGAPAGAAGPLQIGGNTVWGEWYSGLVDDVRVYNRALSAAELAADMARGV